jgi:CelD/BcsL family acetyltransferase involved in cellulose biosynthesis
MNIQTIRTFEEFLALRDEWNALLAESASDCVFLTHEWLSCWWNHLAEGRRLSIITARENGRLTGVMPLTERRAQWTRMTPRALEFIGSGVVGSDYLDAFALRGREATIARAFAEYLREQSMMLQLSQLRGETSMAAAIGACLQGDGWDAEESEINVCPYIDLAGRTWDAYVESLGPQVRKGIKRCLRHLPRDFNYNAECVRSPEDAERALDTLIELHRMRWGDRSDAFRSAAFVAFHKEFVRLAAARGWLRIFILHLNGAPVASLYGMQYGKTFYFYQSGFDAAYSRHSVGVATMAVSIQNAIEEEAVEYDFLHGSEEYKFHWTSDKRALNRIELHPPHARAWAYKQAIGFNRAARQMARRMLDRASHVALNR